jgi:hypothetical protein
MLCVAWYEKELSSLSRELLKNYACYLASFGPPALIPRMRFYEILFYANTELLFFLLITDFEWLEFSV